MRKSPLIMGILNVTPDSFSDGGVHQGLDRALAHAARLVSEGADILDVGGESSRPGAVPVSIQEEMDRVLPVVEAVARRFDIRISVDTRKFEVGAAAVESGATIINDIEGGRDPRWLKLLRPDITFLLMHMQGTPQTMQASPEYPQGLIPSIAMFLNAAVDRFVEAGFSREQIWVDPGFGFGKTLSHCLELLGGLGAFESIAGRLVVGTSRKSFLARLNGDPQQAFEDRLSAGLAADLWARSRGASVFRVHEVTPLRRALAVWEAVDGES